MGMFDWIDHRCKCDKCGSLVYGFQSKDDDCLLKLLSPLDVHNFYGYCFKCDHRTVFKKVDGNLYNKITELKGELITERQVKIRVKDDK